MKKAISIIVIFTIIIIICIIPSRSYAWCNTISFQKDIKSLKLILSNGQILYDLNLTRIAPPAVPGAPVIPNDLKNLSMTFVVETYNNNANDTKNKEAIKKFINETIFDATSGIYRTNPGKVQIGIVPFEDVSFQNTALSNVLSTGQTNIINAIDNVNLNSNQSLEDAVKIAQYSLINDGLGADYNSVLRIIVLVTDGITNSTVKTNTQTLLRNATDQDMINIYGIFVGTDTTNISTGIPLQKDDVTTFDNVADAMTGDNRLKTYVENRSPKSSGILRATTRNSGALVTPSSIVLTVDEEIIHGATLKVEYNMKADFQSPYGSTLSSPQITEIKDSRFNYSKDEPLLSNLARKNSDENWLYNGTNLIKNGIEGNVVFTYMVTSETLKNSEFANEAKFTGQITIQVDDDGDPDTPEVDQTYAVNLTSSAPKIILLPPFGTKSMLPTSFGSKNMFNIEDKQISNKIIYEITIGIIITAALGIIILKLTNRRNKK